MQNYYVVIPAAGQGKRMNAGKNKQFLLIDQIPLLIHTLRVFEEDLLCKGIVIVVNKDEEESIRSLIKEYRIKNVIHIVVGGEERQQSVYCGLQKIEGNPIVLIHDGARPFIQLEDVHHVVKTTDAKGAAVIAVPVKDTVKLVDDNEIVQTVDRSALWSAQTPQGFHLEEIKNAHKKAAHEGFVGTDDASLMEYLNRPVAIVEGNYENLKITTPEDLLFAEAIIKKRKEAANT
ncbi:2-C-methyl-D-erythritol 4-phosphate cytidylyltransferase [Salipaludibacillus agaradhaerens]|uniref:2-C-methyl-D-erythritol 4-phosphate cytidylyltransferase n=1 Tax=Salipaludibacillus agaradhaerens TaxID=76935 RepID=UPI002151A870|nr:2-C-methyl-D-erythritol 4-phosphate cytidylyltransferase [Salipaludibacillus agaradhaerens]MCR6104794.1 2-C-methyl-D-erythritol 4-phosphate cytidylyltransferase [Salipaludibacillus agaradhaerens]MCR6116842.1 2-C-methyl-D-erythritol 4-phosphate cytidylyltransferase [Salipaludibacillus agaradhaerens]UJW56035.1 2-C-methyl-D-erythritol 4-phosphate cytidylyltransferase [Bacillus sp. A116_S68]